MTGLRITVLASAIVALGLSSPRFPLVQERPPATSSPEGGDATVAIVFHDAPGDDTFGTVTVTGLPENELSKLEAMQLERSSWIEFFSVHTSNSKLERSEQPAVLGSYAIERGGIRFRPRFPFVAGMSYQGQFDGSAFDRFADGSMTKTPSAVVDFTMPEPAGRASTTVEAVYPSATELPENLLRLYVYFSAPMRTKDVETHVHLYTATGEEVALPFVEIRNGLWDPMQQRLTLFFHPGRIKRGVAPNLEMGPALRRGESFRLVIEPGLKDVMGYPLAERFEKEINVGPPDRESPNPSDWEVSTPASAQAPLIIRFPEPLDYALLQRMVTVEQVGWGRVAGSVEVSKKEAHWQFWPDAPWAPGDYVIHVEPTLEDVAGNTFFYLFDEEMSEPKQEPPDAARNIEIEFRFP